MELSEKDSKYALWWRLTVGDEAKGKTGIEDGSLNLTWETIYLLAVQLVYTIQALIPEQYLVDFAAVKNGFSKTLKVLWLPDK